MASKDIEELNQYKTVRCKYCTESIFPFETYPWGTCAIDKKTICQTVRRSCNKFKRKEDNSYGKNK